ncbi:MAG: phosphoenolpyruvate--protein phosphotransferase [Deltaproteobacteria bacterium]|nr:MAG: phosphoenolpyruvate--protein phosphotransferase [Deltaproteobacteria bacterium]
MPQSQKQETILRGISGSPGICIGQAYLFGYEGVNVVERYRVPENKIQDEINRFKMAVKNARAELQEIIDGIPNELKEHAYILETHVALHKDKMLYGKTLDTIEGEGINADWALKQVTSNIKAMFRDIKDPYLKGRVTDIVQVSDRIMRNLTGGEKEEISKIDKRVILIAHDLSPAEASQIQLERIKGFVTDHGGKTSHTCIIAKTLELPSVLGLDTATHTIKNEDIVIVDGMEGLVIVHPTDDTLIAYQEKKVRYEHYKAALARTSGLAAESTDGFKLKLMGNIELPEEVVSVRDHYGDGIGLFRTEFHYLSRDAFPTENELYEHYKEVVDLMDGLPVTIRTLDINGDKALSYASGPNEPNPALGLRAIRFCLKRPDVFLTQLRAILRAAVQGNIRLMFPMISCLEEVLEAKALLDEAARSLEREGVPCNRDIKVGVMIEIPSAVIMADTIAPEVDFFSIGTNDLVQYSLAIDRGNRDVAHLYNTLNPAVLRLLKQVVDVGRTHDTLVSMCGEMAGDPINVPILLGMGMTELSMNPQSIPEVKNMIRAISKSESELFFKEVMQQCTTDRIEDLVQETYGKLLYRITNPSEMVE